MGQSYRVWVMNVGRVIMWKMKHSRHTPVTVEQYLRDQIVNSRAQTLVTFLGTDLTNHCGVSDDPYTHMYTNHGTFIRQSKSVGHSDSNNSDKNHINVDTQQDNAGVNNPNMLRVEVSTGPNNVNMPEIKHGSRPKIIQTRSGWMNCRPQRLDIMEEQ